MGEDACVVYAGHDRGARTMVGCEHLVRYASFSGLTGYVQHRAAVDNDFPGITGLGLYVADIVRFVAEYASFANRSGRRITSTGRSCQRVKYSGRTTVS